MGLGADRPIAVRTGLLELFFRYRMAPQGRGGWLHCLWPLSAPYLEM